MHEVGKKVGEALRAQFPELDIKARERDYGNILGIAFQYGDRRYAIETPDQTDYRQYAYQVWLHRAAELIRQKTGDP